jgi:amino acid transporter
MVFHGRPPPRSLCDFIDGNDHLVSLPLPERLNPSHATNFQSDLFQSDSQSIAPIPPQLGQTLTYDSMCEEVQKPATQVPKAMVATIILNTCAGLVFLIPLVFVMPDQATLAALVSGQPVPSIIKSAVGSSGAAIALLSPLLVLGLFCGIGCTTAASRCTWAFARDGAIPGSQWWKTVNVKLDVPFNAMMLSMAVQLILGLIYFGSSAAFNAFSGVGVICLTLSYACPIAVSLLGGRKQIRDGSFHLGALGTFCNVVSLGMSLISPPALQILRV